MITIRLLLGGGKLKNQNSLKRQKIRRLKAKSFYNSTKINRGQKWINNHRLIKINP
jgi:hypothetical protein